ncbi:iron ABC transporter substrate-binding protein [Methylobacterium sp. WL12]|uniref:iron ABC transporter substrate-binding protein n=1 Tax=Methylobacterium sp. WL12 TaxID=2603890 RepID=UPI0011C9E5BE|nr:iron ABC transporter substrate-binding protein [Methylobacterium sp. WL12]TXM67874.1 iron ABC transporter substrate-binding protein [Methylobacterium sp. WL12]
MPHPRRLALTTFAVAILTLVAGPAAARPFTDAAGRVVEVPDCAARVVAAGPPAAVLLYTLAPDRMAGWVRTPSPAERPYLAPATWALPATGRLTGRGGTANVEAVLALKPDLVVDVGSTGPTYASLADRVQAQTGIPYILLDGAFAKTGETYRQLGAVLGLGPAADGLAAYADRTVAEVAERVARVPEAERPRVYYARGPRGLETGFAGSISTEILEVVGARNVAVGGNGLANVSPEQVLGWNPDVIVALDPAFRPGDDPIWRGVKAVREGRVYRTPTLPFAWFDAPPGVNRLIGMRWLAHLLYPALFHEDLPAIVADFYQRFYHVALTPEAKAVLLDGAVPARR